MSPSLANIVFRQGDLCKEAVRQREKSAFWRCDRDLMETRRFFARAGDIPRLQPVLTKAGMKMRANRTLNADSVGFNAALNGLELRQGAFVVAQACASFRQKVPANKKGERIGFNLGIPRFAAKSFRALIV